MPRESVGGASRGDGLGSSPAICRLATFSQNEWDVTVLLGALAAFTLPLTLLLPNFSVWDVVPKVHITRCHLLSQHLTWPQLNATVVIILTIFFCLYLELRKRKLDDMVESVMTVSQATDTTMEMEKDRQAAALRACVDLLDASAEHYEHLVLLRDELRKRDSNLKQRPPAIEISSSDM